jgi:hypothetical protein
VPLHEWNDIIRLCKKVSASKYLTEGGKGGNLMEGPITTLPLPNIKNPLEERPTDKRSGWQPLDEYFKQLNQNPGPKDIGHLFEG